MEKTTAAEVLRKYAQGERDFRRLDLRLESFKGENLAGADFSGCDIRSADFSKTNLTGAKFIEVRAGKQQQWAIRLFLFSLVLLGLLGLLYWLEVIPFPLATFLKTNNIEISWFFLFTTITYMIFLDAIRNHEINKKLVHFLSNSNLNSNSALALLFASTLGPIITSISPLVLFLVLFLGLVLFLRLTSALPLAFLLSLASALVAILLGNYLDWCSLKGTYRDPWIHNLAVVFTTINGTTFDGANLTDADFTQANLQSTSFQEAILIHTRWHKIKNLDWTRIDDNSILAKKKIRNLLISGNGVRKSYERANLRGSNLAGVNLNQANLKLADLGEATLENANLERANLTEANFIGTNLSGARMTGACLEGWNIDGNTKLDNVDCEYIFLREKEDKRGTRERRPHDLDREFEPGEFEQLYRKVTHTVQILIRHGINKEAFNLAFQKVMEENEGITYESLQGVEKKGDDVLITLEVSEKTDKGKVERKFKEVYEVKLEAEIEKQTALLKAEQRHSENLREIAMALITSNPSGNPMFNIINEPKGEIEAMSGESIKYNLEGNKNVAIQEGGTNYGQQIQNNYKEGEKLTQEEVVQLLAQIKAKVQESGLSKEEQDSALMRLNLVTEDAQAKKPDKQLIASNLKQVTATLAEVSKTTEAGKKVWENVKPMLVPLAGWLKVAVEYFLGYPVG